MYIHEKGRDADGVTSQQWDAENGGHYGKAREENKMYGESPIVKSKLK